VKIGDLVVRTYGEGQRPMAIIVGWYNTSRTMAHVLWFGATRVGEIESKYLELLSENR